MCSSRIIGFLFGEGSVEGEHRRESASKTSFRDPTIIPAAETT